MCKPNGSYSDVQCDKFSSECWCVDQNGDEIFGTRTLGVLKCSSTGKRFISIWWDIQRFWVKTKPHIVNIVHELIPYNQYSNTMRSGFRMAFFLNLQESN